MKTLKDMMKLSDVDAVTPSYPNFLPSRTPGSNIPSGTSSPLDYFLLFFGNEIIDIICENSNSYAVLYQDKYPYSYKYYFQNGLNRINFYQFLSIVIYMPSSTR